jgi:hypothetical protein
MSSEVFPIFPGVVFDERQPYFATEFYESPGGTEQRVSRMAERRWRWRGRGILRQATVAPSPYQSKSELDCLLWFHERHKGAGESFLFLDPAESWRSNLFPYSEPLLADTTESAGVTQGSLTDGGLSNGITFPALAQADNAYEQPTIASGVAYVLSVFVKMADLSAPVVGTTITTGDFGLYSDGALHTAAATITNLGGNLYRVSSPRTATVGGGARDCGVVRYSGQSGKGFTVSGWQIEPAAAVPLPYVKTSGAAFSAQKRVRFADDAIPGRRESFQWYEADFELVSVLGET